jgi:hypothetical protein
MTTTMQKPVSEMTEMEIEEAREVQDRKELTRLAEKAVQRFEDIQSTELYQTIERLLESKADGCHVLSIKVKFEMLNRETLASTVHSFETFQEPLKIPRTRNQMIAVDRGRK